MNQKLTLSIGIPAYNEEANIAYLLKALLEQENNYYFLEKIIVSSDVSTDNTVKIVRELNNPKIEVIDNQVRSGPAKLQEELVKICDSDVLVLLNADILPKNQHFLDNLIKPIAENNASLTCAALEELAPKTFFERIVYAGRTFKRTAFEEYKNGNNLYTCHGTARALAKELYKELHFGNVIAEDAYSFLYCVNHGMKYVYPKDAKLVYRIPNNFKDHKRQSIRFRQGREELIKKFDEKFIASHYNYPKIIMFKAYLKTLLVDPIYLALYTFFFAYLTVVNIFTKKELGGMWNTATSTKALR